MCSKLGSVERIADNLTFPVITDLDDPYDSDSSLPGLLVESSDSEGENDDDDDDDDFVVVNKSTTPELLQQEHDKARPPASTYFDEFELNPDLQESIYFRGSNDEDETSAEIIEKTSEPNASTTRSGRTYGSKHRQSSLQTRLRYS
jgi:hypothetical protein